MLANRTASRPSAVSRGLRLPVRAQAASSGSEQGWINPNIQKDVDKVATFAKASELPKPKCVVCRCWRSAKFPYCDGAHMQHNKATGDNVGPFVIETDK